MCAANSKPFKLQMQLRLVPYVAKNYNRANQR